MNRIKWLFPFIILVSCLHKPLDKAPSATDDQKVGPATATESMPAPKKAETPLEIDPRVTIGKLDNGLTYFLQKNAKPEKRLELRLVLNAGSILEDDDQRGLAHFIEHMAFNGTAHFKKQALVDYLESIGMQFGSDLNAFTSFEETVYMIQVPTDDGADVDKALQILADWAGGILFEPEEVEKERGVVLEEWRLGRDAQGRIQDKQFPLMYKGSKFADRLPIGDPDIIEHASRDTIMRFYKDWYRPDLMAVIVVGDLNVDDMKTKVTSVFSGLKNPEQERKRPEFQVPDNKGTLFSAESDPELTRSLVQIMYKKEKDDIQFEEDLPNVFSKMIYSSILNDRLQERAKEADPPYLYGYSGFSTMSRHKGTFVQAALVNEGQFERGIKTLLEEAERVNRFGITQTELDRVKKRILRYFDNQVIESDKVKSSTHASQYVRYFLADGKALIADEKAMLKYGETYLPDITLEDLQALTKNTITSDNRIILISAPEKEGLTLPDEAQVEKWCDEVAKEELTPFKDDALDKPLVSNPPQDGKIVKREYREDKNVTYWELGNGIRVFIKPTDFYNDDITMTAYRPGGTSLADDADLKNVQTATELIEQSGYGGFSKTQLEKELAGKIAHVYPYISSLYEGISGGGSVKDMETLFQLIYLKFTAPQWDPEIFQSMKKKKLEWLKNRDSDPESIFYDKFNQVLYMDNPRLKPTKPEDIESIDPEKAMAFFKGRFSHFNGFTFVFVGNLTPESLEPFVLKYLASLPSGEKGQGWRDNGIETVRGNVPVTVYKGLEDKSSVSIRFTGPAEWSPEEILATQSLSKVLRIRLREILREDKSGVYGVSVGTSLRRWPRNNYSSYLGFGCSPDNVDELISAAFDEIRRIQKEGVDEDVLVKVREGFIKQREEALKENNFWLNTITTYDKFGLDLNRLDHFEDRVMAVDSDLIKKAAVRYFDFDNVVIGKLFPESRKPTDSD